MIFSAIAVFIGSVGLGSAFGHEPVADTSAAQVEPVLTDSHLFATDLENLPADPFRDASSPFVVAEPEPAAPFPILLNRAVERYVTDFLSQPDQLQDTFDRSQPYLKDMMTELRSRGVPEDLVYLAFAESLFSREGRGPWQFDANTARRYGLRVDDDVDERRDPILSTRAAAEYLADLHDAAGYDWRLAVVGWNAGEGAIDRYWSLRGKNFTRFASRLPRRTRTLLGRFMAVAFIAHHANAYGLAPVEYSEHRAYHQIFVQGGAILSRIATLNGTTLSRLRELNPALLSDRVPLDARNYSLRVPLTAASSTF